MSDSRAAQPGRQPAGGDALRRDADPAIDGTAEGYRLLAENAADVVFRGTRDGIVEWISPSVAHVVGWLPEELVGRSIAEFIHPDDLVVFDAARASVDAGAITGWRVRIRAADGTHRWMAISAHPIADSDGVVTGRVGSWRDIQAEVEAETALAARTAELEQAQRHARMGPVHVDLASGLVRLSGAALPIYGITPPDGTIDLADLERYVTPESARLARERLATAAATGETPDFEQELVRPDGSRGWILIRGVPVRDPDGRIVAFDGTAIDITDRKLIELALAGSEDRYRLIAENASDVVYRADPDGTIRWLSPSVTALLGWTPEEMVGRSIAVFIYAGDRDRVLGTWRAASEEVRASRVETRLVRRDGDPVWVVATARPVRSPDGTLVGLVGDLRDIESEIGAREALAARTMELEEAQRLAHVGSWTLDVASGAFTWSNELYRIFGHEVDAPIPGYAAAAARYDDTSLAARDAIYRRAIETGEPWEVEYDLTRPDGSTRRVVSRGEALRDASGVVAGLRGTVADITERRAAEQEIATREADLAIAQAVAHVGSAVWAATADLSTSPAAWSREMLLLHGMDPEGPSPTLAEFGALFDPETARFIAETTRRLTEHGEPFTADLRVRGADGVARDLLYRGAAMRDVDGPIRSVHITAMDITDQREVEAELREAQRIARVGSWQVTVDGAITGSEGLFAVHGLDPADGPPDLAAYMSMIDPADASRVEAALGRCMATGDGYEIEYAIRWPDGTIRRLLSRGAPTHDAGGTVIGVHGTLQDVTEQRELEVRLRQAERMEAIGRLAGGVAHDFNNLLAAIGGYAEFARAGLAPDDPVISDIDGILDATGRAATLTRQLLAFSRQLPVRAEVVDPAEVVDAVVPMVRRLVGEHVEIATTRGSGSGFVTVDPTQLDQVIVNLAVNARDAMPQGGRLAIDVRNADCAAGHGPRPGPVVRISVTDTGTGMDSETSGRAFEPFFTTKEVGKGTGLGLATVYGIVEQAGGHVAIDSHVGIGTTFTIDLPRVDAPVDRAAAVEMIRRERGSETVLLVEDEEAVRTVTARMLEDLGYAVVSVPGPETALALPDGTLATLDLLVTDVVMPGMSGTRLADALDERRPGLPAILISGFAPEHAQTVRPRTVFLPKPFSPPGLAAAVRRALDRPAP